MLGFDSEKSLEDLSAKDFGCQQMGFGEATGS